MLIGLAVISVAADWVGADAGLGADEAATSAAVLSEAFRNRYDVSFTAEVEMFIGQRGSRGRRRVLQMATLHDARVYRAMGQLTFPEYLRGMTVLSISEARTDHQAFVYLPSQSRVRRVSITHKDDAFLGSDLTYEDFERRHVEDYELTRMFESVSQGENVFVVECRPITKLKYDRAEFSIAKSDFAILEIREYRKGRSEPFRHMTASRDEMQVVGGHILSSQLTFESPERNTATEVRFTNLRARRIDDRLFTVAALERRADLSKAAERRSTQE